MKLPNHKTLRALTYLTGMALFIPFAPTTWAAYNSGSTGADGVLNPTVNTEVVLPPSGVLNYSSVNIPNGVTVTFKKNASNTPVVMLVSGDATIAGTIDIRGQNAASTSNILFASNPGEGGPGGYLGGRGGRNSAGGAGLGPGGGGAGLAFSSSFGGGGSGGGYSVAGSSVATPNLAGGIAYGTTILQPLLGGSGGGGGYSPNINISALGLGGGGGGGALLIAASGTFTLPSTGKILATGGAGGNDPVSGGGGGGGGGSGGAIRLVAPTVSGSGTLDVLGGNRGGAGISGGNGASGRIRIEGETITLTPVIPVGTAQAALSTSTTPAPVFVAGTPALAITSVGGINAPANPAGSGDITVPGNVSNPVTVTFASSGIPVGNVVKLMVVPAIGVATTVTSTALTGSTSSATASASVTLPDGPSVLQASVMYSITVAMGQALSQFAQGERVE
ncbi:MAG: hypothetical protein JNM52_09445, partial [Betaproteobacteria bacterium]|nr:hypothetical protein [Betaproteobacteria bacterium]